MQKCVNLIRRCDMGDPTTDICSGDNCSCDDIFNNKELE